MFVRQTRLLQVCYVIAPNVYGTVPLNPSSRLVSMFHLFDVCVSGYCPSTWEAREMWSQRFAFTTFPDAALEIERVMHLFPVLRPHNVSSKSGSRGMLSYKCATRTSTVNRIYFTASHYRQRSERTAHDMSTRRLRTIGTRAQKEDRGSGGTLSLTAYGVGTMRDAPRICS